MAGSFTAERTRSVARRPRAGAWQYPYSGPARPDAGPSPRQVEAHARFAVERFYGGAAGGGKSDWLLAELVGTLLRWRTNGVIFRRTFPDLARPSGLIMRLRERIPPYVGTYNATDHQWRFRTGSVLELGHLERDADALKYQGAEYGVVAFDELTQFTEWQFLYLLSRLRVSAELEAAGFVPFTVAAANPGGPGHGWVKRRYIDPAPAGTLFRPAPTLDEPAPGSRLFIPARVDDNPGIDTGYVNRLRALPDDDRRALLDGDWDVYAGQRFREFRVARHVIDPEELPIPLGAGVSRAVGIDYGYDAPFAALWGAKLADGLVVVYRELYTPGLTPAEQARAVLEAEAPGERAPGRPVPTALDPSTWARSLPQPLSPTASTGPPPGSIAREYRTAGLPVEKASNDRLAGVALVADKLRLRGDGRPRLLIYSTCRNLLRTLPALPRDPRRPEDVDTNAEDHAYDALRYLLFALESLASAEDLARRTPRPPPPTRGLTERAPTAGLRRQGF